MLFGWWLWLASMSLKFVVTTPEKERDRRSSLLGSSDGEDPGRGGVATAACLPPASMAFVALGLRRDDVDGQQHDDDDDQRQLEGEELASQRSPDALAQLRSRKRQLEQDSHRKRSRRRRSRHGGAAEDDDASGCESEEGHEGHEGDEGEAAARYQWRPLYTGEEESAIGLEHEREDTRDVDDGVGGGRHCEQLQEHEAAVSMPSIQVDELTLAAGEECRSARQICLELEQQQQQLAHESSSGVCNNDDEHEDAPPHGSDTAEEHVAQVVVEIEPCDNCGLELSRESAALAAEEASESRLLSKRPRWVELQTDDDDDEDEDEDDTATTTNIDLENQEIQVAAAAEGAAAGDSLLQSAIEQRQEQQRQQQQHDEDDAQPTSHRSANDHDHQHHQGGPRTPGTRLTFVKVHVDPIMGVSIGRSNEPRPASSSGIKVSASLFVANSSNSPNSNNGTTTTTTMMATSGSGCGSVSPSHSPRKKIPPAIVTPPRRRSNGSAIFVKPVAQLRFVDK